MPSLDLQTPFNVPGRRSRNASGSLGRAVVARGRRPPWSLDDVPLARRAASWRLGVAAFLAGSVILVLGLWVSFAADYPVTRDVYFTVALVHVLAEAPFLVRAL